MKKVLLPVLLGCTLLASGCSTLNSSQHNGALNVSVDAHLKADVQVGEKIAGTASGTVLFRYINLGMPSKFADGVSYGAAATGISQFTGDSYAGLKSAAAYEAVTKSGADIIVAPKYIIDSNDYLFFQTVNVTVTGYKGTIRKIN